MKATIFEDSGCFSVELIPETLEENLKVARIGLMARKGARTYISVGADAARASVFFYKSRKASATMIK